MTTVLFSPMPSRLLKCDSAHFLGAFGSGATAAKKLYDELSAAGVDVLLDDRDLRPGVMFADLDLIGIPHRLTIGERGLAAQITGYKNRASRQTENVPLDQAVIFLKNKIQKNNGYGKREIYRNLEFVGFPFFHARRFGKP